VTLGRGTGEFYGEYFYEYVEGSVLICSVPQYCFPFGLRSLHVVWHFSLNCRRLQQYYIRFWMCCGAAVRSVSIVTSERWLEKGCCIFVSIV
jgi:hypothetical protein